MYRTLLRIYNLKIPIGIAILCVALIVMSYTASHSYAVLDMADEAAVALTFNTTSTWDEELFSLADRSLTTRADISRIVIPPPPANDSRTTKRELAYLLRMRDEERNSLIVQNIKLEQDIYTTLFLDQTISEYVLGTKYPATTRLLGYVWGDLSTLIMREKRKFDRIRPHNLIEAINPVIDVPRHPAYPSGHATQSYFLALVLSEVDPDNKEVYLARAIEIAHNREIAGVHYPSDSEAGRLLATQFYEALAADSTFADLLAKAKLER